MKKLLLIFAMAVIGLALGCKDETRCVTSDFVIINRVESDVVVEFKFDDKQTRTIEPGETRLIETREQCYEPGVDYLFPRELLDAEMTINGELIPISVWWVEYWSVALKDGADNYSIYTLTVTDELLETIKTNK